MIRLRDHLKLQMQQDRLAPQPGALYVLSDWQENGTLYRGPEEVGEVWRAQSRTGYATHGSMLWAAGMSQPHFVTFLTRVVVSLGGCV